MLTEIISNPVAVFITIVVIIHIAILSFMAKQRTKREIKAVQHLQKELKNSENQLQQLFDTMHDNRKVLTENLRNLAAAEEQLTHKTENNQSDEQHT